MVSHVFTWFHTFSLGFTYFHLVSHISPWFHTFSLVFTRFHGVKTCGKVCAGSPHLGQKKFFEGGFQASAGILWLFVSTTTDTAKHHSAAVTLTMRESGARMLPAIVASFSSSRKASEVIMWECILLCMGTECNFPLAALAEVHLKIFFRSLRSRKDTPM